jgi:hypothetical protein
MADETNTAEALKKTVRVWRGNYWAAVPEDHPEAIAWLKKHPAEASAGEQAAAVPELTPAEKVAAAKAALEAAEAEAAASSAHPAGTGTESPVAAPADAAAPPADTEKPAP